MKEEFLQYVWNHSLYDASNLCTTSGLPVRVTKAGQLNNDSGPDFFNSRINIDDTLWAGNIEIHIHSSDWMQHGHQFDSAYNNVILHVVFEHDMEVVNQQGKIIPTIQLRGLIPDHVMSKYNTLNFGNKWIPCENLLGEIDYSKNFSFVHRLYLERLEDKIRFIQKDLDNNRKNWEQTFYEYMARNFGFKTNSLPFHILAKSLPLNILAKYKTSLLQVEALLFGQGGFLDDNFEEEYPNQLKKEYQYLRKAHQLDPIHVDLWKFATMRPANFPTVRIAQFANLVHSSSNLFSKCMEVNSIADLIRLMNINLHEYWSTHYQFDKPVVQHSKSLGRSSVENVFMNTVAPFMYAYGKDKFNQDLCDKSISLMENIPAEVNGITRNWKTLGFQINSAFDSQAYIQLKNMYCTPKKCLSCGIGNQILHG